MSKRIFIVNSVKGGCGKSTISLYLAHYLQKKYQEDYSNDKSDNRPIIIDLDLCASSWRSSYQGKEGYKGALKQNGKEILIDSKAIFINDMLYNSNKYLNNEYYCELSYREGTFINQQWDSDDKGMLRVVLSDSKRLTGLNEDDLDLLESIVFKLVEHIWSFSYDCLKNEEGSHLNHDDDNFPKIYPDIIFDMPPGYEKHTDRIIRHLIMDLESTMNIENIKPEVFLLMVSNVDEASFDANIQYVNNLFLNPKFSMDIAKIEKDHVIFLVNDVNDKLAYIGNTVTIKSNFKNQTSDRTKYTFGRHDLVCKQKLGQENVQLMYITGTVPNVSMLSNENFVRLETNSVKNFKEVFDNVLKKSSSSTL